MVIEKAFAKINLFLDVTDRREDGFHNILSVMHTLTLCDTVSLRAERSEESEILLSGTSEDLPNDESNLVYRSAKKYLEYFNINAKITIHLEKKIPIGAGLGGGSADAAATLRAMNRVFALASEEQLLSLAAELGSDVPFCLLGGTAICRGRGEVITPIQSPKRRFAIAIGKERIATPRAYAALDERYSDGFKVNTDAFLRLTDSLVSGSIDTTAFYNIFESVTEIADVQKIKEILTKSGAEAALMSGSGPSVFASFEYSDAAVAAVQKLRDLGYEAYFASSSDME